MEPPAAPPASGDAGQALWKMEEDSVQAGDGEALIAATVRMEGTTAAVALASLNDISCLNAVTHIPDANCSVQVRLRWPTIQLRRVWNG
jgi:hypothetical protein